MTNTTTDDALATYGTLYRDSAGHEVWTVRDSTGAVVADGIASDHDAAGIAQQVAEREG